MSVSSVTAVTVGKPQVSAFSIPTDSPESDGTLRWDKTVLVVVEAPAADRVGLGYTYADAATAKFIADSLAAVVTGQDAMNVPAAWAAMAREIRNHGRPGIVSMAMAAVDAALWDLKARLLELPLARLLGMVQDGVQAYGSGGFTSYSDRQLADQLAGWADAGLRSVKMKVGREPARDHHRVALARQAIGPKVGLMVDANGAYSRKQALAMAELFIAAEVSWFEEPVSSDDLAGLHLIRNRAPAGMDIAAGEYGYQPLYFRRMLEAQAVDVLQADASRCGIDGFLAAATMCRARSMPLSCHCAPALHLHPATTVEGLHGLEYFHDHVRIEQMLFDGAVKPQAGVLKPDLSRAGNGLELRRADAQRFAL
jgi:L-alanine-DL-glutamate epimerase-like enolase superfamily enzyme